MRLIEIESRSKGSKFDRFVCSVVSNSDIVGFGKEKVVYEHPTREREVIALGHNPGRIDPLEAKARYYVSKLTHLLFPEIIPDVSMVSSNPYIIIMDKVEGQRLSEDAELDGKSYWPDILRIQRKFDLLRIFIDHYGHNFILDPDGNIKYVDGFEDVFDIDEKLVKEAIEKNLEGSKKRKAHVYLYRICTMRAERGD